MLEITIDEAVERLNNANAYLYAEIIETLGYEEYKSKSYAYESHGAVILKQWYWNTVFWWHLCDIGNSDMASASADLKSTFGNDIKINRSCFLGDIPSDYDISINVQPIVHLRFGGVGKPYHDSDIRLLSDNDRENIISLAVTNDNRIDSGDNEFEDVVRNLISDFDDENSQLLGIFDGATLAGAISLSNNNMELRRIFNIFVSRKYRGRKYATRLLRTALSLYPGSKYDYDCDKSNLASVASAKSAGFILAGTFIPS